MGGIVEALNAALHSGFIQKRFISGRDADGGVDVDAPRKLLRKQWCRSRCRRLCASRPPCSCPLPLLRTAALGRSCQPTTEPPSQQYKQWLQRWYLHLGYEHRETLMLRFEPDEVHEMYACLRQLVPCKYILFDKRL